MNHPSQHTFHIPVMGIGYTIDTPLKVAQYGISSVISLVDDILIERMREFHSMRLGLPFTGITNKISDFRAKRITAYLNLMDKLVKENFEELKSSVISRGEEIEKYFRMLPDSDTLRKKYRHFLSNHKLSDIREWLNENLHPGSIDVNIMTKLDKENFKGDLTLPVEFNDAHAALRGFAESNLESGIVLSAGLNPRLYSYFENFSDFFPDEKGYMKKKIILKVSDYRSALIQGKFFAKKGLWVSEFRIESGLNCGGHAFATQGFLLGPILEEFKSNRESFTAILQELYFKGLQEKNKVVPQFAPGIKLTAQGGVGTADEHEFLMATYQLDSVGWGTPFMLVPEICNIDESTLTLLSEAKEKDLYLSNISPLGVPFNTVRNNTLEIKKQQLISQQNPGALCVKKYASLSKEFGQKAICVASRIYQRKKIKELDDKNINAEAYQAEYNSITEKSCICNGLGTSVLIYNGMNTRIEGNEVALCPGPNAAYFSEIVSLEKMTDHIYGRTNIIKRNDRPHVFIKELELYVDYLSKKIKETTFPMTEKQSEHYVEFISNLKNGIDYYRKLIPEKIRESKDILAALMTIEKKLQSFEK